MSSYDLTVIELQLQAMILENYGIDCIQKGFIDAQPDWLGKWTKAAECGR